MGVNAMKNQIIPKAMGRFFSEAEVINAITISDRITARDNKIFLVNDINVSPGIN